MTSQNIESLEIQIKQLEEQLRFYRDYDSLTGVCNKHVFYETIQQILDAVPNEIFQIITVDIERFRLINDFYGTEQGDALLQYLAHQLQSELACENSCFSRIGSDVFAVFLPSKNGGEKAADKIVNICRNYPLNMEIIPAIGIYEITDRSIRASLMCDRSVMAGKSVKGNYVHHLAWYNDSMRNLLIEEQDLLNNVETSLANHEFEIYIQPKCNMKTGLIVGGEVLVRWNHPLKGLIPPTVFIPLFERNGFIKKLDAYVWEQAARWLHQRKQQGLSVLPLSVNVSRSDIFSMDVFAMIKALADKYELDAAWLEIEVTESAYSSRTDEIIQVISQLMNEGFTVSMDDFGSGYSSLNILKDININVLKLDIRFLDNNDRKSKDIVESVVHMAKWLDLKVIAEGVENREQVDFLLGIGCVYAQGFYYYRPMKLTAFEELISDESKIDVRDHLNQKTLEDWQLNFKDLFHEDMMSEALLNNILGQVVLYSFDGQDIRVMKANEQYYNLMCEHDMMDFYKHDELPILEEDRPLMMAALLKANENGDKGSEVIVRRYSSKGVLWVKIRLFYLSEINNKDIYYASVSDVSDYMETIEELKLAEKRFYLTMESGRDTIFELDIATRTAYYAKHTQDDFGLSDCVVNAPEGFIEQGSVCEGYEDDFIQMYQDIYDGKDQASCTIQAHMGDDSIVWNHITLTAVKDENGKSVKAVGLIQNVTKEKEMEMRKKQSQQTMKVNSAG